MLTPTGGGGGNVTAEDELGLSIKNGCERCIGDRPFWCRGAKSGEIVVASLTGVPYRDGSESGDTVSAGEVISVVSRGELC